MMNLPRYHAEWVERPVTYGQTAYYHRKSGKLFSERPAELSAASCYTSDAFMARAPLKAYFDFTYLCNLRCAHCITSASPTVDTTSELPTPRILELIDELARIGVLEIQTAGGEPFVHPDWQQIYQAIVDRGLNLIITTNGLLLRPNVISVLQNLRPLEVRVSFDGGPELHEQVRGPNTYRKAIDGLAALCDAGLNATARLTLCRGSESEMPTLFADLKRSGTKQVKVALVKQAGRAATEEGADLLRPLPDSDTVNWLFKLGDELGLQVQLSSDDFTVDFETTNDPKLRNLDRPNCGAGFESVYISPRGEVLGCVTIPNMGFGVLHQASFVEVWEGKFADAYRTFAEASGEHRICDACSSAGKCSSKPQIITLEL